MGKIHSKQVCKRTAPEGECFLVNTKVTSVKDLVAAINNSHSFSEAFVELGVSKSTIPGKTDGKTEDGLDGSKFEFSDFVECCTKPDSDGLLDPLLLNIPLRVSLPPLKAESELLKLLTADGFKRKEDGDGSTRTDTTDNNHGSEKSDILKGGDGVAELTAEETNGGPELQEWLFTLYDFDDLGKITKEDISGLLKSLHDTVGSVITLQRQGARVLKLHLTVTPCDKPKRQHVNSADAKVSRVSRVTAQEQCTDRTNIGDGTNVISGAAIPSHHHCCAALKKLPRSKCPPLSHFQDGSPRTTRHKPTESQPTAAPCGRTKRAAKPGNSASKDVRNFRVPSVTRRQSFSGRFEDVAPPAPVTVDTTQVTNVVHRRRQPCGNASKRLSQFDDQHLAQLIQKNMDLNDHHHHHHSRKSRRHHNGFVSKKHIHDPCVTQSQTCVVDCPVEESTQRRNYYLDLAGIENYDDPNDCDIPSSAQPSFGVFGDEELIRAQRKTKPKSSPSMAKHSRLIAGRTTDAPGADAICEEDETIGTNVKEPPHSKTLLPYSTPVASNEVDTASMSHYHRRHRHRERDQSRAMKQVAEWIEKEHVYHKTDKRVVVVQRHEHHHIHEHFHHHIHHGGET